MIKFCKNKKNYKIELHFYFNFTQINENEMGMRK